MGVLWCATGRLGSSPRMRGAHYLVLHIPASRRIIPADAGSTAATRPAKRTSKDHPRGCGEHPASRSPTTTGAGSSPRMRGAQGNAWIEWSKRGIIPADAGSTSTKTNVTMNREDHPRGCGEHSSVMRKGLGHKGSSPRMRGARVVNPYDMALIRIIPADAGST